MDSSAKKPRIKVRPPSKEVLDDEEEDDQPLEAAKPSSIAANLRAGIEKVARDVVAQSSLPDAPSREALFAQAANMYLMDEHLRPVDAFYPLCSAVWTLMDFRNQAILDQWDAKRRKLHVSIEVKFNKKLQGTVERHRREEAAKLKNLFDTYLELLTPKKEDDGYSWPGGIRPRSIGEMAQVALRLAAMLGEARRHSGTSLLEEEASAAMSVHEGPFAPDELKEVSQLLLSRRAGIQDDDEDDSDE